MAYQPKSYRKFLATSVATALVATAVAPTAGAASFSEFPDLVEGAWYQDAVSYALEMGYLQGFPDGTFQPAGSITRAQAAQLFANILDLEGDANANLTFSDLTAGAWYTAAIDATVEAGIFTGYPDNSFRPNQQITRGEFAVLMVRAYDLELDEDGEVVDFPDVSANSFAREAIAILSSNGIINGLPDGTFGVQSSVTRAQGAAFIYNTEITDEDAVTVTNVAADVDESSVTVTADVANAEEATISITPDSMYSEADLVAYAQSLGVTLEELVASLTQDVDVVDGSVTATFDNLPPGDHTATVEAEGVSASVDFTVEAPADFAVASVTSPNAAQLQVRFNRPVQASSVIDANGTLRTDVLGFARVSGLGNATITTDSLATLSDDGRTLTVNVDGGAINNLAYVVTIPGETVRATDGTFLPGFTSNTITSNDTTAPAITNVEKRSASQVRVFFSEPLAGAGTWSFALENGNSVAITPDTTNLNRGFADIQIPGSVAENARINATIIGAQDFAGNLISPNPTTFSFTKGARDGVKPTVTNVTATSLSTFELTFSEELLSLDRAEILVGGSPVPVTTTVERSEDNANKWIVTLPANRTPGLANVTLNAGAATDLSGETSDAFSRVIDFVADTTNPTLVSSNVVTENGRQVLILRFSEPVVSNTVTLETLATTRVLDFVTTTGEIDLSEVEPVANTNNREYRVELDEVEFDNAALQNNARYTVTLNGFADVSGNPLTQTTFSFTRGTDSSTARPVVGTIETSANNANLNNNQIIIPFGTTTLNGASAVNPANYTVQGLTVSNVELLQGNNVRLTLAEDTNTLSGNRNVTVRNVQSRDGVSVETTTRVVNFIENVRPTVTSATLTDSDEITVTFSEAVNVGTNVDFELLVGGQTRAATTLTSAAGSNPNQVVLTVGGAEITGTERNAGLSIRALSTIDIEDLNNNPARVGTVTVQ